MQSTSVVTDEALLDARLLINRELSWLAFNDRVLNEAVDSRTPLLERLKFLSIVSTNLDEFYMVRVAGLRRQVAAGVTQATPDGMTPQEQLDAIDIRVKSLLERQRACLYDTVLPELAAHGVRLVGMGDLTPSEWAVVDQFFETQVFPVLTPLAVDPAHPFPYISNLSLSLAVEIRDTATGTVHFARVKVPKSLPRWVPFGRAGHFIPLELLVGANLGALFPGMEVVRWFAFRVNRYSDIDLADAEEPEDLLASIEEQVFQRRFGEVVRIEVQQGMPETMRALLLEELRDDTPEGSMLSDRDVQEGGPLLELGDLLALSQLDVPTLRDAPFAPVTPAILRDDARPVFDAVRERDLLVHHPYDSFTTSVERFLEEAAEDPDVLAIKLTLYRTSGDTAIVRALVDAAQRGKQVVVVMELKARFDEANNIAWARTLERAGVHVVYGLVRLKTHAKTALVVRREPDGIRRYVHLGSGNYNSRTARIYTDLGFLTSSPSIGADVSDLFNFLTGFSRQRLYRKLLVAPGNLRERFTVLIEREAEHARAGRPARIVAKMNALVDPEIIRALYRASRAGVDIDLIVRGICCLRPGVLGVSDRIRVRSIVGRFLEHSRAWMFENDGAPECYIGSSDWMPRNFDRRVEAVVPIEDPALHARMRRLLETSLADNRQSWELRPDGSYDKRVAEGVPEISAQVAFMSDSWGLPLPEAPRPSRRVDIIGEPAARPQGVAEASF
ncbi:MAG TPA: polyphosphate kinase 1 [Gemmatimonadaceae bacterium]|nr:polyphosphate kinase 1 [Gemmatimonadaceae bacterium]